MGNSRLRLLVTGLVLAIGLGGLLLYQQLRDREADQAEADLDAPEVLHDGVPGRDPVTVPKPVVDKPPASPWLEKRTRRYFSLFKDTHCDVLVVPVQVEGGGFDRPNREIMTAELALALAANGKCVSDPYLVDLALGEGLRRRSADDILALARTIKASRIVTVYAGHYTAGQMRVTMQLAQLDPDRPQQAPAMLAAHSFEHLQYGAENPPFMVFRAQLPAMLAAVGLGPAAAAAPASAGTMPQQLPASLEEYLDKPPGTGPDSDPLQGSARLAFLATLAPFQDWNSTERLYTKAWVALENADAGNPAVRRLRARILLHLHERPLALAILKGDSDAPGEGLRAVLNGNLPQAREALAKVDDTWERFFLGIDVMDLELEYGRDASPTEQKVLALLDADSPFRVFAALRLRDRDDWGVGNTVPFKAMLEHSLPLVGVRGMGDETAPAAAGTTEGQLAALRLLHELVEVQPRRWCCNSFNAAASPADLLDLLDSRIELILGHQAYYLMNPQGNYEGALAMVHSYDPELAGSPCTESLRAEIYWRLMEKGERQGNDERRRLMHEAARATIWWRQEQNFDTDSAFWYMHQEPGDPAQAYLARIGDDYPPRDYWWGSAPGNTTEDRLAFSADNPEPLQTLLSHSNGSDHAAWVAELKERFVGAAQFTDVRARELTDTPHAGEFLRSAIAADRDNWSLYNALAQVQLEKGAYADVRDTVLAYPPFSEEKPRDPVSLTNYANGWGRSLQWVGATTEALPLLKKAAGYRTGSNAGDFAEARVALLDERYADAAAAFAGTAEHYDDMVAYRELLCLMFAAGLEPQAWNIFDQLSGHYRGYALWVAPMVGHREAQTSDAELAKFYADGMGRQGEEDDRENLRIEAFVESITDRALPQDFPGFMNSLAGPPRHSSGHSVFGKDRRPKPDPAAAVPDYHGVAAEAFVALRANRYEEAVSAFDRLAGLTKIEDGTMLFTVPSFAYAAAKTGDKLGFSQFLDGLPSAQKEHFSVWLGRAIFAALGGKQADAKAFLQQALQKWSTVNGDHFPFTAYQYLQTCDLLYAETHDDDYRQDALRLARMLRKMEPAFAYSHALVALLSDDRNERVEALATALYLDPRSQWAAKAPPELHAAALARLKQDPSPFAGNSLGRTWESFMSGSN
jgi:hypothetical protein